MNKFTFDSTINRPHSNKRFFAILFIAFLTLGSSAQINHIDFEDIDGNANFSQTFDIDNDGTDDFTIASGDFGLGASFGIAPLNSNEIVNVSFSGPAAMLVDESINSDSAWSGFGSQAFFMNWFNTGFITGNWQGVTDRFVGLKYNANDGVHYAWLRMDVTNDAEWTIKDYAYNTVPDAEIAAGQTMVLGNDKEFSSDVNVYACNNEILIKNLPEEATYELYSITGQRVSNGIAQRMNHSIEAYRMSTGIYVLKVEGLDTGKTLTKKVLL